MTSTIIDTNILVDVLEQRQPYLAWVQRAFTRLSEEGPLVINQVIYGEASVPYPSKEDFDALVLSDLLAREDVPWEAAFRAGKAFDEYRRRGGVRAPAAVPMLATLLLLLLSRLLMVAHVLLLYRPRDSRPAPSRPPPLPQLSTDAVSSPSSAACVGAAARAAASTPASRSMTWR